MFKIIQSWPDAELGMFVGYVRTFASCRKDAYILSGDEHAAIEEGIAEADYGELLDEEEVFREFLPELR